MRSPATKIDTRVAGTIRMRSCCVVGSELELIDVGIIAGVVAAVEVTDLFEINFLRQ